MASEQRDPFERFDEWFKAAAEKEPNEPNAMALATVGADGMPSVRMVLLKGVDDRGFVFYTNYESQKGQELTANPRAALVFYWSVTRHQIRVYGRTRRLSRQSSAEYFASRPRGAQLSALASRQSRVIRSRDVLERRVVQLAEQYPEQVPLPRDWGGYALRPRWIEFWENREDRLHDRLRYTRDDRGAWRIERLAP